MKDKKLNSLQACRGIAALMVVLYHANGRYAFGGRQLLGHIFSFGFAGVDFFFVLSGFIIAYTSHAFLNKHSGPSLFLKKRFARIYPIYWIYLAFAIVVGYFFYHDNQVFENFWKTVTLFYEHRFVIGTSWTLPFEVFFYLLFAIFIYSRWSLILIIPIAIVSVVNTIYEVSLIPFLPGHILNDIFSPFNVEFLFGILAFRLYRNVNKLIATLLLIGVVITAILEIQYFKRADYGEIYPGMHILPFGIPALAAVTALAALDHKNFLRVPAFLVLLGDASYSLYLIHGNIFNFANDVVFVPYKLSQQATMQWMNFLVPFVIILSILLYKLVEKPLLIKCHKLLKINQ